MITSTSGQFPEPILECNILRLSYVTRDNISRDVRIFKAGQQGQDA
jgi:hypothetical protein